MDTKWLMIQTNGFIAEGRETIVSEFVTEKHGWESPEAAASNWRRRGVFDTGRYQPYGNGRQYSVDVSADRHHAELGISATFNRVYFVLVPAGGPPSAGTRSGDLVQA